MFRYLMLRVRVAKVQAELMAQVNNQDIVNNIFQKPQSIELIDLLYQKAYYRKRKDAAFLIVCALMIMVLNDSSFPEIEKDVCYHVLKDRFIKMQGDKVYCVENFMVVGDCEVALALWDSNKARG